jgi:membrane protein
VTEAGRGTRDLEHPRGRIAPTLPPGAPWWRRTLRALLRLGQGMHYHDALRAAPAMAFHLFLSLLPLLVFIGWVVGLVAQRRGASAVLAMIFETLPETTEGMLKGEVSRLANAHRLGPLAAAGFLWIASGGTQGLMVAVEAVVGAPRRAWWKKRLIAMGWVLAALAAFGVAAFAIVEWDAIMHPPPSAHAEPVAQVAATSDPARAHKNPSERAARKPPKQSAPAAAAPSPPKPVRRKVLRTTGERLLALTLSLAFAVGGLCGFYRLAVSHAGRVRRRVLPGAALAVGLWIVVSWGFSVYLRTLASYTVYYGSLAAVAVLLVWLWLVCLAILAGAELNAQLEGLRDQRSGARR